MSKTDTKQILFCLRLSLDGWSHLVEQSWAVGRARSQPRLPFSNRAFLWSLLANQQPQHNKTNSYASSLLINHGVRHSAYPQITTVLPSARFTVKFPRSTGKYVVWDQRWLTAAYTSAVTLRVVWELFVADARLQWGNTHNICGNASQYLWKVPFNVTHTFNRMQQRFPPTPIIHLCVCVCFFKPNSSISLHPPSSHPPQVVCRVQSSTVWINDWCSRPQVKVRKVHYWIIPALLSLLPSAWLLLVDVVEALEGTLFANALKTWTPVCASRVSWMFFFFVCKDVSSNPNWHNMNLYIQQRTVHTCVFRDTHLYTLRSLLVPIYQRVDNESQHLCFQPAFVSSAFILMEPSENEGNMLLDRASFTLWFCFAVSEADRLGWTQGELIHSTDHALSSTNYLWGAQTALLKMAK